MHACIILELCNLELLELGLRRLHAGLIMMNKILNGIICVNLDNYISLSTMHHTKGETFKLYKYRAKLDKKIFFTLKTVNVWNSLPNESVNSFVKRLKSFNILHFLKGHACQWYFTCTCLFLQYAKINLI